MIKTLRFTLAGLLLWLASRAFAAVNLTDIIDEQCPVVFSVQDMPALIKNWNQSPFAKTWNDDQMKKFLAPLRTQMKVDQWDEQCKAETGYTVTDLLGMAKGQVLVALTSADLPLGNDSPAPSDIPLLIAVELGSNASKVAKIIGENDEKQHAVVHTEDFAGVKLHVYQKSTEQGGGDDFTWAMTEGIWLIAPAKATVQKSIDAVKKGRVDSPLAGSERFLQIKKRNPEANVTMLVNFQSLYPALKTAMEKRAEQNGAPMGMPPGVVLEAIGLGTLRDLYLSVGLDESATSFSGGLTYSELRGLFKMLAYRDGPVAQPAFVSEKWITVSSACFSFGDAYGALKEFLEALNPMIAGMVQGQIKNLNQQLGVDLERDLIGSLGTNLIVANAGRPGAALDSPASMGELDQLYSFSLVNAGALTKAVDALKRMAGPQADKMFTKREYLGYTIYSAVMPGTQPGQKGFSYAITPKYLFVSVGTAAPVETALQGLDGKQPTLWQKPEVKAALAEVPASASAFEYQNTRLMVGNVIAALIQVAPMLGGAAPSPAPEGDEASGAPAKGPFDLSAKPDIEAISKYWSTGFGYAWRDSQGLYVQSKMNHPK